MKRIPVALLCLCLFIVSMVEAEARRCEITPVNLTCEKMAQPNCIDVVKPRLSWVNAPADDSVKGAGQSAYRIRVATSCDRLGKADLWDSRKVRSEQSVFVPYAGKLLSSGQQVWWQVKVWDGKGKASEWSEPAQWRMGVMNPEEWCAEWIGAPWQDEWEAKNTTPAPYFRKEVNLDKKIASAVAFVTGLGYFEFYVNGEKIGDEVLVPNFTNYSKRPRLPKISIAIEDNFRGYRVMYLTYDITESLKQGENALGMIVGNGWYNTHTRRWPAAYGSPRMLCQIKVTYEDGSEEVIVSDESWKVKESAIVYNDEYIGETYDARQETADWCSVGCDESTWQNAVLREAPTGELCASYAPLDKVIETLKPVSFEKTDKGWEVDFGKEISGWLRFDGVMASNGDVLQVKYVSESPVGTQKYIFGDGECKDYAPKFAWYVFRKAIITGAELNKENVVAEVVNTDVRADAEFSTSNPLLNQINTIWRRSLEDNLHGGVMSDCPHREKSPYTGDGQVCCETVMANYDCYTFYHKWLRDMRDAQNVETGHVPNSAPWQPGCGGGVGWGAAVNIMPWEMYRHFGDVQLLEESYFTMTEQMRFMMKYITEEGIMDCKNEIVNGDHRFDRWLRLGEWVAPHGLPANHLVHTYFLWRCADVTSKAAAVLGKADDEKKYRELAESVKAAFHKKYYDPETKSYGDYGANVFALHMGVPQECLADVVETFRTELTEKYGRHLNTGIFGTRRLFEMLAQNGLNDLAYEIINQKDYPSFGWWIEQGATTTWERWDGKDSRNHPMFGGGLTWFYNTLAGVNIDETQPGYKHTIIKPLLLKDLEQVTYSKMTPYGQLKVEIEHKDFTGKMTVTVPVGATADVYLPHTCAPQRLSQGTYTLMFSDKSESEIYSTTAYTWKAESVLSDTLKAYAPTAMSLKTNALSRKGKSLGWTCRNDISKYGVFKGSSTLETALYNLAVDEMVNNIEKDGTLRTGALWGGVWTRDVSYSAILSLSYMVPENVRTSLEVKIDELGRIIQDTGTGGSWPCSSDRVIWAVAAWKVYLATGDEQWLKKAYHVILKSLESDLHMLYDKNTGLYRGESSFIDWRQQSYPLWMQPADIYMSECLGTNVVYSEVFENVASMAEVLGDKKISKDYRKRASDLRRAVNDNFWLSDKGYYGSFLYGRNSLIQSGRSETLGESLAILWDVADKSRSAKIMKSMPVSAWGPAIFWPQISSQPDYHNNATWPFVTSYWGMAAAKTGNESALLHALGSNVRSAAIYATNYENFTNSTGNPYTTKLNSHNMLWGLSGFMGLFHKTFFGFEFTQEGLYFHPCVPKVLDGRRTLEGFPYRGMLLDISVSGSGNVVRKFTLDGKTLSRPFIPADLTGKHEVVIELAGEFPSSSINVRNYTPAPEYPVVQSKGDTLVWNPVEKCEYAVVHNGNIVAQVTDSKFVLPSDSTGEWQVIPIDGCGVSGFASEPLRIYPETISIPLDVRIDEIHGMQTVVSFVVPEDGTYVLDWRYANGNGSVTGYNMCSSRTLVLDSEKVGVCVFPQRGKGDWADSGWSSPVVLDLAAGKHIVEIHYNDDDVNMNVKVDNARIMELRLVRID